MSMESGASWWQRMMQIIPSSSVGSWIFAPTLHHIDLFLMKWSGGRWSIPQLLTGLPVVKLTATGAKSGKERTVPLLGIPSGDKLILIASNWGRQNNPAWYRNLKANPEVTVEIEDETGEYVAHEATGSERERYWNRAVEIYPGYKAYQQRTKERQIPVVVLTPKSK